MESLPLEYKVLILGIDDAGKTKLLYTIKLQCPVMTISTVGYNFETVEWGKKQLTLYDIGGQPKMRDQWKKFYTSDVRGIIYVYDITNPDRLDEAAKELCTILQEEYLAKLPIAIFANKIDQNVQMDYDIIVKKVGIEKFNNRDFCAFGVSAQKGTGVETGIKWRFDKII